jgi:hypothetical protein
MLREGFNPTILGFERAKVFCDFDRVAIVIGRSVLKKLTVAQMD